MGTVWELDFYSRPLLNEEKKKLWEVVVCESPLESCRDAESLFRFSKFCPPTEVNSIWLRNAIEEAIAVAPAPPSKIRFFRRQMNNMITKACKDIGLTALPSRRTIALNHWLEKRMQEFYPLQPGFDPTAVTSAFVRYQPLTPQRLPDALEGKQWAFVTLEAGAFEEMPEWDISFGEAFPLKMLGIEPETRVPGVIIFSPRAMPIAAWMSGMEIAFLKVDGNPPARLLLETGANDTWILANLSEPATQAEAKGFEEAKQKAKMVHFIAVQSEPQAQSFAGFWLLQELNLA